MTQFCFDLVGGRGLEPMTSSLVEARSRCPLPAASMVVSMAYIQ